MKDLNLCRFAFIASTLIILQFQSIAQLQTYQNYDFTPGNELIFEDNFEGDRIGEWAAHWELEGGQGFVTGSPEDKKLLMNEAFTIKPLMKSSSYLSNNFSIEFDAETNEGWLGWPLFVMFYDMQGQEVYLQIALNNVIFSGLNEKSLNVNLSDIEPQKRHFAIAYKDQLMKLYIGERRVLTIPNLGIKPARFAFHGGADEENAKIISNVRVANGAQMNMLSALFTDGKFITYGITFDVNKAVLKPESMGVLNELAKLLKENKDIKLEIGGHTDSDGNDANNLTLSQQRADAVVKQLISMGIASDRLVAIGYGETKPIADNSSFEGKAKNRRVEFKKL